MTAKSNAAAKLEGELIVTRILDASPETVYKAWTDPKQMARWWGPNRFTNPVCELDVRPGGAWRIVMRAHERIDKAACSPPGERPRHPCLPTGGDRTAIRVARARLGAEQEGGADLDGFVGAVDE